MAADGERFPLRSELCARTSCSDRKAAGGEEFRVVARQRSQSSRGGVEERECAGVNEV
jgi:hypothetical protein